MLSQSEPSPDSWVLKHSWLQGQKQMEKKGADFNIILTFCAVTATVFLTFVKVARYSFSGSIPPKFEHKLPRHKQSFGKIATTVVLDEDENLL